MSDTQINSLPTHSARKIIEAGSQGNPPEYGFQFFTAGIDIYLNVIEEEYLKDFIKNGGSAFKMVIGNYGLGKTHFLYSVREIAWKYNYLTSYIALSPTHTPFHRLDEVYKEIVANLMFAQEPNVLLSGRIDKGIQSIIKKWYKDKYIEISKGALSQEDIKKELRSYCLSISGYESISFQNAIREGFISLVEYRDEDFELILQWLRGENPPKQLLKKFRIFDNIDKTTAFKVIRSLVQWVQDMNYTGIVVLMDEAEQNSSLSSKQKDTLLNNLRELIDECNRETFSNTMWFYAVPNTAFLSGRTQIYEALNQRVATIFEPDINPSGVQIDLEKLKIPPLKLLCEIGEKLVAIYERAYGFTFKKQEVEEKIKEVAEKAIEQKFQTGYKRTFVQNIIQEFHKLRKQSG